VNRLIVVSNRVSVDGNNPSQSGLGVALSAALKESGGIWFGWSGEQAAVFNGEIDLRRRAGVTTATVALEQQDIDEYYDGYANRTLWPLFHYRIDLAQFERGFAGGYQRVNRRLAVTVAPLIEPGDRLWVHDYHLIPLGSELRRRGYRNPMGFFLHTPWPPRRLLTTLPEAKSLVESLFAYDVVGFQASEWLASFLDYATGEMAACVGKDGFVRLGGRRTRFITCPIGIDAEAMQTLVAGEEARAVHDRMRASAAGRAMIVGVDRLDYAKGLEERFLGYERFLAEHPEQRNQVFLLQLAPPTRAAVESYQRIRNTLDALSGRINGAHADLDWVPIRYVNQGYPAGALAGIYRAARVGLVTPLRDGMNIVAKEYVAAQDGNDPGVLILSRFTGAAEQLEGAVLVNPHSAEEISDAIRLALDMPLEERIQRWRLMMNNVERENVIWWRERFTEALRGVHAGVLRAPISEVASAPP
jgi:trehalose 6-phosphate synthase